ncbi:MAG: hypothetical protein DYG88_07370 [Chloroflexi bacterium CFX4]|nr:hypothetical protein [Chloroflexi bacterium CFX4]MDL1921966.1 hypothetical protein [Chloroflexi bacterium CFX3]
MSDKLIDPTPDHIFIKVYPSRLRALAREYNLTRAEIGELVLLACYINDQRECYPSKADSVEKIGMRSAHWARQIHRRLAQKGVIQYVQGGTKGGLRLASTFRLPDAFFYGSDSYRLRNSAPVGDRNSESGWDRISDRKRRYDSDPQPERLEQKPESTEKPAQQHSPPEEGAVDPSETAKRLAKAGVKPREAALIAAQYSTELIESVLRDAERGSIGNKGGWIRAAVERRAGRIIRYPDRQELAAQVAATAAALKAATTQDETVDPYLRGSYFQQQDNSTE